MDADLQLTQAYRAESAENLAAIEQGLLAMERRGSPDTASLQALLRAAHTLKGNSQIAGRSDVAQATHALEDTLEGLRANRIAWTESLATELLAATDTLREMTLAAPEPAPADALAADAAPAPTPGDAASEVRASSLRVAIARLDTLLDLTGEIAIARGRMSQLLTAGAAAGEALGATLWQLEQLHGALQQEVMQLRMVPLEPSFAAQRRTVRDAARACGRQARLVIAGGDVEVDTSIAEQLRDPLTHLLRNAVDHGIEPAAERLALGKSPTGTITLRAEHRGDAVVVELSDDGRGLDRARIAAKAQALGLVADAAALTDEQLYALIFESGLSTAETVTPVSGRGVGMDVVRRHVLALRGTIEIASSPGNGTRFTIRLPLTVAIISGFTVGVGGERYVLPLDAVEECVDFAATRAHGTAGEGVLNLRGAPLPYMHLADVFGLARADARRASVVVVRHAERRIGLVVDVLDGDCQAVIKPLAAGLQRLPALAGSTILGNGRVALILDVPRLIDLVTSSSGRDRAA